MKTLTLNVLKKNRKYFAATHNGYKAKILIDECSADLEFGTHDLTVDDISIRTKYGTDVIYKLSCADKEQKDESPVILETNFYNSELVEKCKKLGGIYSREDRAWIFKSFVEAEVEELDYLYNSELIDVEIELVGGSYGDRSPYFLAGFQLAKSTDRDSGAVISSRIAVLRGDFFSAGSLKNWRTETSSDTVIRMKIPKNLLDAVKADDKCKTIKIL